MCGLVISAFVLSLIGALAQRALASALGVPARFVLGIGPRLGDREAPPRSFEVRPMIVWAWVPLLEGGSRAKRAAVRAIGPLAIVLVPYLVLTGAIVAHGVPDDSPSERMIVGQVMPESPAERAGIERGDVIVSVEGAAVRDVAGIAEAVRDRAGASTRVELERDGARRTVALVPVERDGRAVVGVRAAERFRPAGPGEALATGARIVGARIGLVVDAFAPREAESEVTGPIGMVRAAAASRPDGALMVALLAASWTALALLWSIVAAISETVRAVRGGS